MKLKIAELRKGKGISQQELADILGISYQAVSKWGTNVTLPDITMLPKIAGYYEVSVDELLELKPLRDELYIPSETGTKDLYPYLWYSNIIRYQIKVCVLLCAHIKGGINSLLRFA